MNLKNGFVALKCFLPACETAPGMPFMCNEPMAAMFCGQQLTQVIYYTRKLAREVCINKPLIYNSQPTKSQVWGLSLAETVPWPPWRVQTLIYMLPQ